MLIPFNKFTIKHRLIFAAACMALIMTIFTVAGVFQANRMLYRYNSFIDSTIARQEYITSALIYLIRIRFFYALSGYTIIDGDFDVVIMEGLRSTVPVYHEAFLYYLSRYRKNLVDDVNVSEYQRQTRLSAAYGIKDLFVDVYLPATADIMEVIENSDSPASMLRALEIAFSIGNEIERRVWDLQRNTFVFAYYMRAETNEIVRGIRNGALSILALFYIFCFPLFIWILKTIRDPINKLKDAVAKVAMGDLNYPIRMDCTDELGVLSHNIGNMVEAISEMNKAYTVADYMDTMIYVTDLNNELVYINKSYAEAYSLDKNNYEGKTCYELCGKKEVCDFCVIKRSGSEEIGTFNDYGILWSPSLGKWIEIRAVMLTWLDGRLVHFCYMNDATEKKHNIDQQQIYELQLEKAAIEAQTASVAKSAFIANTSHELLTPMNSIMGYSELVLDDDVSESTRECLKRVVENAKRLLKIINDLIDVSRIESGTLELENVQFDITEVLNECDSAIRPLAVSKNIMLHFYVKPHEGRFLIGDPVRLTQVCINILSNAIKFTNYGVIKFYVTPICVKDSSCTLQFEIKDSGIGMDKDQIDRIFETFVQADGTATRKYGGTGIGLSVSKSLIEVMGSKLEVQSVVGVGSIFSFTLTFSTVLATAGSKRSYIAKGNDIAKPHFDKGEILIAEDNEMNQGVICEHLSRLGLKFTVVSNGKEAVEMVRNRVRNSKKPFDLIFMDIHMPVMSGMEASSIIAGLNVGTPIIAMTANVLSVSDNVYKDCGMEGCVNKPFTTQELWRVLIKYIVSADPCIAMDKPIEVKQEDSDNDFFKKMKIHFINGNKDIYEKMTSAIQQNDFVFAHRLAHNLKSNAGHVQKNALQTIAAEIEQMLKNEMIPGETLMDILKTELGSVLKEFLPFLEEKNETEPVNALNKSELLELIQNVEPLLISSNVAYLNYINKLKRISETEDLIKYMENFDSPAALASFMELKKKWM